MMDKKKRLIEDIHRRYLQETPIVVGAGNQNNCYCSLKAFRYHTIT